LLGCFVISLMIEITSMQRSGRGAVAAVVGAVVATAYGVILDVAGVPMRAGAPGATTPTSISLTTFAEGTLAFTIIAVGLAWLFERRAPRPRHTFVVTTVFLTVVSLALPLATGATNNQTARAGVEIDA
jgi:drug/metabolite transporter (DMT)-like permease